MGYLHPYLVALSGQGARPLRDCQERRVQMCIGGEDMAVLEDHRAAVEPAHPAARFLDDQAAGGEVPRFEAELEEAVVAAVGDPGEIERGAAKSADGLRFSDVALEQL